MNRWLILGKIEATSLLEAYEAFLRSFREPKNEFTRNSTIQCFEFTLELVWKTLKRVLEVRGLSSSSPRETFRLAAREKLIDDPIRWFEYIELRNLSTHTYKEAIAEKIYAQMGKFEQDVQVVISALRQVG